MTHTLDVQPSNRQTRHAGVRARPWRNFRARSPEDTADVHPRMDGEGPSAVSEFVEFLYASKGLIAWIFGLIAALGSLYAWIAPPVYRADAVLQLNDTDIPVVLTNAAPTQADEPAPLDEAEILKSRAVLDHVVEKFNLDVFTQPVVFPLVGAAIARDFRPDDGRLSQPWFDLTSYAWGGEHIDVPRFDVDDALKGIAFIVVADRDGTYNLYTPDAELRLHGTVGRVEKATLGGRSLTLLVRSLYARPGARFKLTKRPRLAAIENLKRDMTIQQAAKTTNSGRASGLITISLAGDDPVLTKDIVNEIAETYVRMNVERASSEAEKSLDFVTTQLAQIEKRMLSAETALNRYRATSDSVDVAKETEVALDRIDAIDDELDKLQRARAETLQQYTLEHPNTVALNAQIEGLRQRRIELSEKIRGLPAKQQEVLRLSQEAATTRDLYTSLANKAQELRIIKANAMARNRVVDFAVAPYEPIAPNRYLIVSLTATTGLLVGMGAALLARLLRHGIRDPETVEKRLGVPVLSTVPFSKAQRSFTRRSHTSTPLTSLLAHTYPDDLAIEGLRNLRTTLQFLLARTQQNRILISGPGPGVGKSFVCLNLAAVWAHAGKRVLVVDADLRRGRLHRFLGVEGNVGLSDVLDGKVAAAKAVVATQIKNLYVLPSGQRPENPAERLAHGNLELAIETLATIFDYILLDSPPALAISDAAIIARASDVALLVIKDGAHTLREVDQTIKTLGRAGAAVNGVVFNGMDTSGKGYGYSKYYGYAYSYKYKS